MKNILPPSPTRLPAGEASDIAISISQLNRLIHDRLEAQFTDLWVEGEISDPKTFPSGHTYFTLKDADSQIAAVLFKGDAAAVRFKLEHGLLVLARGRVSTYQKRGQIQFIVSQITPKAQGALQLAFEQLKAKLEKEGLFAQGRKRPIPAFPERIGIVTSLQGAAVRDMLHILGRRFDGLHIRIYPVLVQGSGAAEQIAGAIKDFNDLLPDTDVLLVGRGGGSLEDLWAFNEEIVARAIATSRIPVISCVGHETDFTIADFVSDLRAPTPSAAAELVVREKREVLERLGENEQRLPAAMQGLLARLSETLRHHQSSPFLLRPERIVDERARRVDELTARVLAGPGRALQESARRFQDASRRLRPAALGLLRQAEASAQLQIQKLNALSPLACLARGYSIAFGEDGRAIKSSAQLSPRDRVRVRLHEGAFTAEVLKTDDN